VVLVGRVGAVVELDEKGRILIPSAIRKAVKSRRFELKVKEDRIEMVALPDVKDIKGSCKGIVKSSWVELEEKTERFVTEGRR